jgi:hypothetical protein
MRLLIFLMAVSSCRGEPSKPKFDLYQPVSGIVCDEKSDCREQSFCNVYQEVNGEWQFKEELPMSRCNGIFGVNSEAFVEIKDYVRKVNSFIKTRCTNDVAN